MLFLAYILIGVVTGFFAGLFGIGGGTIIVPMLTILLPQAGVPDDKLMAMTLGTSFSTIVFTSVASAWQHHRMGNVDFRVFKVFVPTVMLSVFGFGWLVTFLPKAVLMKMFAVMMLFLSVKIIVSSRQSGQTVVKPLTAKVQMVAGTVIGALSSFAGIGGGAFIVPFLNSRGFEMKRAIGTSSACGVLLALGATVSFMLSGSHLENMPAYSVGFVYVPAFLGIVAASVGTSKFGALAANKLPVPVLKKAFATFLCFVAIAMFFK
ncbi:sulfite exporter TauE/SafE family protein [Kingella negevensis]|uniref:sulfite exporter TauE/SafE family protein n=1 Tax=Kingella negevensis TaxID=1522312 RepID=UPI00050A2592|nr:sulfite exporter TauE/SafE family protein [Kingella negevensis]MDK4688988.1 sulfite exporter TauE/SafE family protein [Kingella negevensis]WII90576.1 sulfite exporter TauE/SafE family protein [Kingella negevensis]